MRYLIRHFLLTLPLVRDTVTDGDVPAFWTDGMHPIIRSLHDADLSKPVDRGYEGAASRIYGTSCRNALERFVTAGLKLSSASHGTGTAANPVMGAPAPAMQPQTSTSSTQRYNFQPLAPAPFPESQTATSLATIKGARPLSADSSASSSWSRRFSLNRIFGGAAPVKNGSSSPPRLPPPVPASPFVMTSEYSSSETDNGGEESRRESTGPARPDSAVLPAMPFVGAVVKPAADATPSVPSQAASQSRSAELLHNEEVEELSLKPTASRTTSAQDAESFVTAGEGRASRAGHSVHDGDDDVTMRIPASSTASAYATPAPSAGLAPPPQAFFDEPGSDDAATEIDGSPDEPSTPRQGQTPDIGNVDPPHPTASTEPTTAEPYIVDDSSAESRTLAPPIAGVTLPYQSSSAAVPDPTPRTPPREPTTPLRPVKSLERQLTPTESAANGDAPPPAKLKHKFSFGGILKKARRGSTSGASGPGSSTAASPRASHEVPASRRVPLVSPAANKHDDTVAHSGLPADFVPPTLQPTSSGDTPSAAGGYEPDSSALPPVLVPKAGSPWPFDAPVPFLQGPDFEQLKWGGFEADVVGCRKSLFSHVSRFAYSLRVVLR